MNFEKLAADKRFSCRSFEQRPIEKPDMDRILEAGRVQRATVIMRAVRWTLKGIGSK